MTGLNSTIKSSFETVNPLQLATVSLRLIRACTLDCTADQMLNAVLNILRELLPFDIATYAEYASHKPGGIGIATPGALVRGRFAIDGTDKFQWPTRWLDAPAELMAWLEADTRAVADIDVFFDEQPALQVLRSSEVVQTYLQRGARSFLVAVNKEGSSVASSLTLARRNGEPFGPKEEYVLDAIGASQIIRLVQDAYKREITTFHQEVRDLFAPCADPAAVAKIIVQRLCEVFNWDYVAIFRIARTKSCFELVAQCNNTNQNLLIKENYTQDINTGILKEIINSKCAIRINDVREKNRHNYIRRSVLYVLPNSIE